jgi:hypothetical protein
MRLFKKYKSWSKLNTSSNFPLRVLKFKKIKWKKTRKSLLRVKGKTIFLNHNTITVRTKVWDRAKNYYKNKLLIALSLTQRYDCKLQVQESFCYEKDFYLRNFLKNEYRVDFIIWSLNFFSSIYEARQHIKNGFLVVNNKVTRSDHLIVSRGDVLVILKKKNKLPQTIKKEFRFSFLEVDYYTQTIVILKDLKYLNSQDVLYNFTEKNIL